MSIDLVFRISISPSQHVLEKYVSIETSNFLLSLKFRNLKCSNFISICTKKEKCMQTVAF